MYNNIPHYKVGNRIYHSKLSAILDANRTNETLSWHFYDDIFNKNDWTQEPVESLEELYKFRAQQIREQFDYIVVLCSGGADSTNVLYSFLKNNLHVDEVIVSAPLSGLSNYNYNCIDTSHRNTISETIYAQLPLAKEIKTFYPKTIVTLNDYFENILAYKDESWILDCDDWMHPSSASRYRFQKLKHLLRIAESGKKLAFVYGIDKPSIFFMSNEIYAAISDLAYNVMRPPFDNHYDNVENVMFYWDPQNIRCITKQVHTVINNIHEVFNYIFNVNKPPKSYEEAKSNQSKFQRRIIPYIYPRLLNRVVFQAEKPSKLFLGEHDDWFYNLHGNSMAAQMMRSETQTLLNTINPKYLNKGLNGFQTQIKHFKIKSL